MSARDRMILGVVGIAAAAAALWFVALAPKRREAADLAARVTQAEQARDATIARALAAEAAKATYGRDYATVAGLGKAVPATADVPSLVYQLESAARAAKVDFRAVRVESGTASTPPGRGPAASGGGGLASAPFTFTFEGTYFGLRKLLGAVDRFSLVKGRKVTVRGRLLTLDGVKLSAGRGGFPNVKAEIAAKAYVAAVPSVPTAGPAAAAAAPPATPAPDAQVAR